MIGFGSALFVICSLCTRERPSEKIRHTLTYYEEIADVLIYCIMLSDKFGFDLDEIILDKLAKNAQRYPAEFAYGNSNKAN